jgi:hypothetical protein
MSPPNSPTKGDFTDRLLRLGECPLHAFIRRRSRYTHGQAPAEPQDERSGNGAADNRDGDAAHVAEE